MGLRFFFEEALASVRRGRSATAFAVLAIAVALFVLGGFLLVTSALQRVLANWSQAAEFSVYLRDDITPAQRQAVEQALDRSGLVLAREAVSKEDALGRFRRDFSDLVAATSDLTDNPFPASYEIRFRTEAVPGGGVDALARQVAAMGGVGDVRYDRKWLVRLGAAVETLRAIGWALGSVLALGALLTVATVVRLALHARRDEVEIMQLVGSPIAFIRMPFVLEGMLQGGIGAIVALVLLWAGFQVLDARYGEALRTMLQPATITFLSWSQSAAVVAVGVGVGALGGLVAARTVR